MATAKMKKYIGTKIVEARPMAKATFEKRSGRTITPVNGEKNGYFVKYDNGYESWSPKSVFEKAYYECDTIGFGQAIEALKKGCKVARSGWNGKDQYIYLTSHIGYTSPDGKIVNGEHKDIGNRAIAFVGTRGVQIGWLASQADMLAEDWHIVE